MVNTTRRRLLSASGATGLVALSGCLSAVSGSGCEPSGSEISSDQQTLPQIARIEQYFRVEVPRDEEPTRSALRLANKIEEDGGTTTTSDQWSNNSGGDNWNMWVYGHFTREKIEAYLDDFDLDLSVRVIEQVPRRSDILGETPVSHTADWYRRGGEYGRRHELWTELPDQLRPLEFPEMSVGRNCVTLHEDVSEGKIDYLVQLLERKGHVNILADGNPLPEARLRPGMIVEPRADDHAEFYFDNTELEFTDLTEQNEDSSRDTEIVGSSQMWQQHWSTEWEESSTQVRISGDFGVVGLPQLVKSHQEEHDEPPTTITLRFGEQEIVTERLESLVETPSDPDSYGPDDASGWTSLPRVSAEVAALISVYLELPYEMDLGAEITSLEV